MVHNVELPEVFPLNDIIVDSEPHRFEVFQGDDGPLPETEYTLDKAPITNIREVTGTLNGSLDHEFVKGTDYELSSDNNDIVWLSGDRPDAGTQFYVTYVTESIIGRYVESGEEEFDSVEEEMINAIEGKFVRTAEGAELDEIGKLFGQTIGKRRGRNDTQYRIYLQSVVQSFVSRGTKTGIKLAISAATEVPVGDITIDEDFDNNEYEVTVVPNTAVRVSLLETIADIADPSGIAQSRTRFPVFDEMGVDDAGGLTPPENRASVFDEAVFDDTGILQPKSATIFEDTEIDDTGILRPKSATIAEDTTINDTFLIPRVEVNEDTGLDDLGELRPKAAEIAEVTGLADAFRIPRAEANEQIGLDESNAQLERDINTALWEEQNETHTTTWNFFEWTELIDLLTTTTDELGSADAVTIPAPITTTDEGGSADAVDIPAPITTTDTGASDDAVEIPPATSTDDATSSDDVADVTLNDAQTTDTTASNDATATSQTDIHWDVVSWNGQSFNWTAEP